MQPNGSRGRKSYDHPGRHSPWQGVDESGSHPSSPSRHRRFLEPQDRGILGGAMSYSSFSFLWQWPLRPVGDFTRLGPRKGCRIQKHTHHQRYGVDFTVVPKGSPAPHHHHHHHHHHHQDTQWMEYFSVEHNRTMKYNPVTGETCDATESTEPSKTDTKTFSPGTGFALDLRQVRESTERPASESNNLCETSRSQLLGGKPTNHWSKMKGGRNLLMIAIRLATTGSPVPTTVQPRGPLPSRPHYRHCALRKGRPFSLNSSLPVLIRYPVYSLPLPYYLTPIL